MPRRPGLAGRIASDARKIAGLGPRARGDLARAVVELAIARLELLAAKPEDWLVSPKSLRRPEAKAIIDRIAFAVPRAAARVPWKATCLVQALAAKHWLAKEGVASDLKLGARKAGEQSLDAHAWLEAGGRVVVGGEAGGYQQFQRP